MVSNIYNGRGALGTPQEDSNYMRLISSSMVTKRKSGIHEESRVGGDEPPAYVVVSANVL